MKRFLLPIGGITALALILWWATTWIVNGGWPTAGPVTDPLPPHIRQVIPADGDQVKETYGFCVNFFYSAGRGIDKEQQEAMRYFIDGQEVTKLVADFEGLEYPDSVGEPCYRQSEPLSYRWHTAKVIYADHAGEAFQYRWRFQVIDE